MLVLYNTYCRGTSLKPSSVNLLHTVVYNIVELLGKAGQGQIDF